MQAIIFDYFGVLAHRYGRCDAEIMEFIQEELVGEYKLAVLSNMNDGTAKEMLGEYVGLFDIVALSGEMGFGKPDIRAYLEVAKRLGEFPSDCLLIDDSPRNCVGAEESGMKSVHYEDLGGLKTTLGDCGIITS